MFPGDGRLPGYLAFDRILDRLGRMGFYGVVQLLVFYLSCHLFSFFARFTFGRVVFIMFTTGFIGQIVCSTWSVALDVAVVTFLDTVMDMPPSANEPGSLVLLGLVDIMACELGALAGRRLLGWSSSSSVALSPFWEGILTRLPPMVRRMVASLLVSDTIQPQGFFPRPMSPSTERRVLITQELISSEISYGRQLHEVVSLIATPLKSGVVADVKADDVRTIFNHVDVIHNYNKAFLQGLADVEDADVDPEAVCLRLIEFVPFFKVYGQYAAAQTDVLRALQRCKAVPGFNDFLNKVVAQTSLGRLDAFLILPVQRIMRYPLLLQDLQRYTPETCSSRPAVDKALAECLAVSEQVNEEINKREQMEFKVTHDYFAKQEQLMEQRLQLAQQQHRLCGIHRQTLIVTCLLAACVVLVFTTGFHEPAHNRRDQLSLNLHLLDSAARGDDASVSQLIAQGADTSFRDPRHGKASLAMAADQGNLESVVSLLKGGALVNALDEKNRTALMGAAKGGHLDIAEALLAAGAATGVTDANGHNAERIAQDHGFTSLSTTVATYQPEFAHDDETDEDDEDNDHDGYHHRRGLRLRSSLAPLLVLAGGGWAVFMLVRVWRKNQRSESMRV